MSYRIMSLFVNKSNTANYTIQIMTAILCSVCDFIRKE